MKKILQKRLLQRGLPIVVLVVFDVLTKWLFYTQGWGSSLFFIAPVCNDGISFSIMIDYWFVKSVSIIACGFFVYLLFTKKISGRVGVLLIAGTLGNLYDRVVYDCVRDFLVFGPLFVFNIADALLTVGAGGVMWKEVKRMNKTKRVKKDEEDGKDEKDEKDEKGE